MGIIRSIGDAVVRKVSNDISDIIEGGIAVGAAAAATAAVAAVGVAATAVGKAVELTGGVAKKVIEKNNESKLRKEAKDLDFYLLVKRDVNSTTGAYTVTDNSKNELYRTLYENGDEERKFGTLTVFDSKGKIAEIHNEIKPGGLFSKDKVLDNSFIIDDDESTILMKFYVEKKERKIKVDFFNWISQGDLRKNNYRIMNKETGEVIATVSKKNYFAPTFLIECDNGVFEPFVVILTLINDIVH